MFDFFRRKKDKEKTEELKKESENLALENEIEENDIDDDSNKEFKLDSHEDNETLVFEAGSISTDMESNNVNNDDIKSFDEEKLNENTSKNHFDNIFD